MSNTIENKEYTVVCVRCNDVFHPEYKSSLWWKAKKREEDGKLDVLCIIGQECGCVPKRVDAPYVVYGCANFNDLSFEQGFNSFVEAIRYYKTFHGDIEHSVGIRGVSHKVEKELIWS